jgi:hypothetical protein
VQGSTLASGDFPLVALPLGELADVDFPPELDGPGVASP